MHNRLLIILCLSFALMGELNNQNTIIASYGSCIDYSPKVCIIMNGQCFDTPCPDCTCRIWLSDAKGKSIINGESMSVTGAKTCCYTVKAPLIQGQTYMGFFNAVSSTYGEGNDTGSVYITSNVGTSMGVSTVSANTYTPTVTALSPNPNAGKNYCTSSTSSACDQVRQIDCWNEPGLDFLQRIMCYDAKAVCVVDTATSSSAIDAGACFLKFLSDLVGLLVNSLGSILALFKAVITFIVGIADSETRTEALSDALTYVWGFIKSILTVLAPVIVVGELIIIWKNCGNGGMNAVGGFISDNMLFFTGIASVLNFLLNIFIGVISMFYNLIFGVKPK